MLLQVSIGSNRKSSVLRISKGMALDLVDIGWQGGAAGKQNRQDQQDNTQTDYMRVCHGKSMMDICCYLKSLNKCANSEDED